MWSNEKVSSLLFSIRIGRASEALFDWDNAVAMFNKALADNPSYEPARWAVANLHLLRGNYNEVLRLVGPDSALHKRAVQMQQQDAQCQAGNANACARIGISLFYSDGAAEGENAAEKYLRLSCPKDRQGCHYVKELAKMRSEMNRVTRNP